MEMCSFQLTFDPKIDTFWRFSFLPKTNFFAVFAQIREYFYFFTTASAKIHSLSQQYLTLLL